MGKIRLLSASVLGLKNSPKHYLAENIRHHYAMCRISGEKVKKVGVARYGAAVFQGRGKGPNTEGTKLKAKISPEYG